MTTLQKTAIALVITGAAAVGVYQTARLAKTRTELAQLQQQQAENATLQQRVKQLEQENAHATNSLAELSTQAGAAEKTPRDLLKLRGEVGRLRMENAAIGSTNAISKITANPESRSMLRTQQKMGMGMLYKQFAKAGNLTSEQTEKLNDLLADHIMDNVDLVTQVLRDKPGPDQMNRLFAAAQAGHEARVQEFLGPEAFAQYKDYTQDLLSNVSVEQFMSMLSVADDAKAAKRNQLLASMKEQVRAVRAEAQLPEDYQLIPMLNFRNIASEQDGERSLQLLDSVYSRVAAQAGSYLTPEEIKKLEEFRTAAINNNRSALTLNRTMMAPISE